MASRESTDFTTGVGLAPLLGTKRGETREGILGVKLSSFSALFNVLCTMAGAGILQLPFTLKQSGWVGVVVLFLVGVMANYTAKSLIYCLYPKGIEGERLGGYPQIGYAAFGSIGQTIVHIFHKSTLIGVSTLYLILSAKFFTEVFAPHEHEDYWSTHLVLVCAGFVLIPCVLLPTMKEVGFLSAFGMTATILVVVVCVVYSISHKVPHHVHTPYTTINYKLFPSAFSGITLSFGGHAVMPTVESHTDGPRQFIPVLNAAFTLLMGMYMLTAVLGYWAFGDDVYSPILCSLPRHAVVPKIAKAVVGFHCVATAPILLNVVFTELEAVLLGLRPASGDANTAEKPPAITPTLWLSRTAIRATVVGIAGVVAYFVPYFPAFMTLIGACCVTMLVFVMPVVFNLKLRGSLLSRTEWAWGLLILVVGLVGGVNGAWQAVKDLVHLISTHASPSG